MSLEQVSLEKLNELDPFEFPLKIRVGIPLLERSSFISELKVHVKQFPTITFAFTTTLTILITTSHVVVSASTSTVVTSKMAQFPPPPHPLGPPRYAPLVLSSLIHYLPQGYSNRIKKNWR